jgi:hypothetical protein
MICEFLAQLFAGSRQVVVHTHSQLLQLSGGHRAAIARRQHLMIGEPCR